MARNFELTTRINPVSRGKGDSATARAAYRACCLIECEREGKTHDYRRKGGLDVAVITLPETAPVWARDRSKLWNGAEARERNKDKRAVSAWKANAQTARDYLFTFPVELSQEGRRAVAQIIADHLVSTAGVAVDHAIHAPGKDGDEANWHCHMMWTTRRMTAAGLGEKTREWDERDRDGSESNLAKQLRAFVASTLNAELAKEGKADLVHVQHETYKARGSGRQAQQHQGPAKTHLLRKQKGRLRTAWQAEQKTALQVRHMKEIAALKEQQGLALKATTGQLAGRLRTGAAAIKQELTAQRQADPMRQTKGIVRGALSVLTGRAGREASARQERDAARVEAAQQKAKALKTGIAAERREFITGQRQEFAALIDGHKREIGKIQTAVQARQQIDRGAERAARQPARQPLPHERQQERGRGIERDFTPR